MKTFFRDAIGLLLMAVFAGIVVGAFFYIRIYLIGVEKDGSDSTLVVLQGTSYMMSAIVVSGSLYHKLVRNEQEVDSIKREMSWRIHLLHILTGAFTVIDVFI